MSKLSLFIGNIENGVSNEIRLRSIIVQDTRRKDNAVRLRVAGVTNGARAFCARITACSISKSSASSHAASAAKRDRDRPRGCRGRERDLPSWIPPHSDYMKNARTNRWCQEQYTSIQIPRLPLNWTGRLLSDMSTIATYPLHVCSCCCLNTAVN